MSFRDYSSPGDVLTSELTLSAMLEVLQAWKSTTHSLLRSDGEGMAARTSSDGEETEATTGAGEEHREVEKAIALVELARRGEAEK